MLPARAEESLLCQVKSHDGILACGIVITNELNPSAVCLDANYGCSWRTILICPKLDADTIIHSLSAVSV